MEEEEARLGTVTVFLSYDRPLEKLLSFKYLGIILTKNEDNWPVVIANIQKARKSWSCLAYILRR